MLREKERLLKKTPYIPYTGKLHISDKLIIPNYVFTSPGKSVHSYSFRDENRQRWVDKKKYFKVGKSNDLLI